ncbi:tRNA (adenosine(37)-N6)-threonylcarbamoyltransferase complex dimerization subunit type 1 TsaB [candidate division WOR-1 bacterium RIFOXYB2_FULL_48_7]|uniref:tRNA (Adenosine(37)-N6)-threonylcarbamoyltransferase complex dimerization subunit type 1 TsaB n=1 Tax=candidate division WOR-1 bacterium RIFOXYB2_FULL_48_7 TaxID=1802583 RepID=A0A1F4TD14_UNCSA|nr:MAG: tRNA (adenosine(37)-N6)-threonylcarbamoyltransferase complex dimerization subunit type 1 TsaB [candidate division WOR-1 bacterium RIFOXYB2_FULL_48_7]
MGLIDGALILADTTLTDMRSEQLIFYVQAAGIKPEELAGVAVAIGPGSYAGLRGGVAAAKTLAQALNIPIAAVSTLAAMAYNLALVQGTIAVILPARHDEYSFAFFGAEKGRFKRLTNDLVLPAEKLISRLKTITGEMYLIGKLKEYQLERPNFHYVELEQAPPTGVNVARLGWSEIQHGRLADPLTLVPEYSHQPQIREYKL